MYYDHRGMRVAGPPRIMPEPSIRHGIPAVSNLPQPIYYQAPPQPIYYQAPPQSTSDELATATEIKDDKNKIEKLSSKPSSRRIKPWTIFNGIIVLIMVAAIAIIPFFIVNGLKS